MLFMYYCVIAYWFACVDCRVLYCVLLFLCGYLCFCVLCYLLVVVFWLLCVGFCLCCIDFVGALSVVDFVLFINIGCCFVLF